MKALEAAKEWLLNNNKDFRSTANFVGFSDEGKILNPYIGEACHASFGRMRGTIEVIATELDTKGRRKRDTSCPSPSHELLRPFINWLVNDSIYAPCILTKDIDEILEMSGIVVSLNYPSQMVMSALVIARYPFERTMQEFEYFSDFLSKGYNPCVSAYISFNTNFRSGNMKVIFNYLDGHTALSCIDFEALKRMVAKQAGSLISNDTVKTCKRDGERTIYGTSAYYYDKGNARGYNAPDTNGWTIFTKDLIIGDKDLQSIIRRSRGETDVDAYRPPNPFDTSRPKALEPWQGTCKELYEVVLPYMKEKGII